MTTTTLREFFESFERFSAAGDTEALVLLYAPTFRISGIEGIRLLNERYPGLPVLMLTVYNDDEAPYQNISLSANWI